MLGLMTRIELLWGLLPCVICLGALVASAYSLIRGFGLFQVSVGVPTIALLLWSLAILKSMFLDNAWPTGLPYLIIAAAVPIVAIQLWWAMESKPVQRRTK